MVSAVRLLTLFSMVFLLFSTIPTIAAQVGTAPVKDSKHPLPGIGTTCDALAPEADQDLPDLDSAAKKMRDDGIDKFWSGVRQKDRGIADEGIREVKAALEIDPRMPSAYNALMIYYVFILKDPVAVTPILEDGLKHNPKSTGIHVDLATAFSQRKKHREAIREYTAALDMGMSCRESALYNIGNEYGRLGDKTAAISYYKQALAVNPHHLKARKNLVILYVQNGNRPAAHTEAQRLLELDLEGEYGAWAKEALRRLEGS